MELNNEGIKKGNEKVELNAKARRALKRKAEAAEREENVVVAEKKNKVVVPEVKKQKTMKKRAVVKPRKIHRTLFVGQVPFKTTKEDLMIHFAEAGKVEIRMLTDKQTKKFRGMAFVEVQDEKGLGAALSRHHTLIKGRRINVEMTASGGGTKSTLRTDRLTKLKDKQTDKQLEKVF